MGKTDGKMVGPGNASRPRNPAIDLYRMLMMFGIVLLHVLSFSDKDMNFAYWNQFHHMGSLLLPCVCGFVLISGYHLIKFSIRKVAALYGTAALCL